MSSDIFKDCSSLKTVLVAKGWKIKAKRYVGKNVEVRQK